ncbi:MAG: hypothetical protein QXO49_06495, partial [Candidatus Bathyarchaeia archaeon]
MGKIFSKKLSASVLTLLMVLPPLTNAYLLGEIIQQPKVFTETFTKTVEVEGRRLELMGFGKVIEYANGTKLVEISVTVENICPIIPKMRINFTKAVAPEELSLMKSETKRDIRHPSVFSDQPVIGSGYAGNLRKYLWDNNSIWFVEAPGNYTIYVKYDHNDNYETYYPYEWNRPWHIPIGMYGNEKLHTHMAVSDVYDWKVGARSRDEIMRLYLGLGGAAAGSFLGAFLGGALKLL